MRESNINIQCIYIVFPTVSCTIVHRNSITNMASASIRVVLDFSRGAMIPALLICVI